MAQPGTIIQTDTQTDACLPPDCGDISESYNVTISGQRLQTLRASDVSFAVRFPDTNTSILEELTIQTMFYEYTIPNTQVDFMTPVPIDSITPNTGQRGTRVQIRGSNLLGIGDGIIIITEVYVGGSRANISSQNSMLVEARVNSGIPGSTSIRINTTQTIEYSFNREELTFDGPYTYSNNLWTQLEDGRVLEVIPPARQIGKNVTICGVRLLGGGNEVRYLRLANQNVSVFSDIFSGCIEAVVPEVPNPESGISGGVLIEADTGALVESSSDVQFTYAAITSISPNDGQVGTRVTISGVELLSGYDTKPRVYLSDIVASVESYSSESIVVRAGDPSDGFESGSGFDLDPIINVAGNISIVVNAIYIVCATRQWTYLEAGEITNVEPLFGQYGTQITLQGTNLFGYGSNVNDAFIGNESSTIVRRSNEEIVLRAPNISTLGLVDIRLISNTGAEVRREEAFEYRQRGIISSVTPTSGQNGTYGTFFKCICIHTVVL